jgi:hypothetical protein
MFTWQRRRNTDVAALLLLLALFLSACEDETPTVRPTPTIEQPVQAAPERSPLTRRDVPPSGVDAQLALGRLPAEAGSLCDKISYTEPWAAVRLFGCSVIASRCTICFLQFEPNQVIELDIYGPQGPVFEKIPVQPDDYGNAQWVTVIDPLFYQSGEYTIHTAQAKTLLATATFTVYDPGAPTVVVTPRRAPPGRQFKIILAGFQPGELVPLHLYHDEPGEGYVYLTSLPPVQMDERGQGWHVVETLPGDPAGEYVVLTSYSDLSDPISLRDASFDLGN